MKEHKHMEGDDGRVVANMNVDGMPWYVRGEKSSQTEKPESVYLSGKEKWAMFGGVMKAVLLVSAVFASVYFLVIFLMTKIAEIK